jgi:hypothetical protein
MISFHFLLHLIALASLFRIGISYTVNLDCGDRRDDVTLWVTEARFLFDRAAKVLEAPMTPNVENILRACLGASATNDNFNTVGGSSYYHIPNLATCMELMECSLHK